MTAFICPFLSYWKFWPPIRRPIRNFGSISLASVCCYNIFCDNQDDVQTSFVGILLFVLYYYCYYTWFYMILHLLFIFLVHWMLFRVILSVTLFWRSAMSDLVLSFCVSNSICNLYICNIYAILASCVHSPSQSFLYVYRIIGFDNYIAIVQKTNMHNTSQNT